MQKTLAKFKSFINFPSLKNREDRTLWDVSV